MNTYYIMYKVIICFALAGSLCICVQQGRGWGGGGVRPRPTPVNKCFQVQTHLLIVVSESTVSKSVFELGTSSQAAFSRNCYYLNSTVGVGSVLGQGTGTIILVSEPFTVSIETLKRLICDEFTSLNVTTLLYNAT